MENGTTDLVLSTLVTVTMRSIDTGRELYPNPLHEPIFYARHFRPWVQSALDDRDVLDGFLSGKSGRE